VAIDLPPSLATASNLPSDYELCFRPAMAWSRRRRRGRPACCVACPVAASVAKKTRSWNAPGAYGYFLSRRGAERLLDLGRAPTACPATVDWRLIAYSIGRGGL